MIKLRPLVAVTVLLLLNLNVNAQTLVAWNFENNATILQASTVDASLSGTPTISWGAGPTLVGQSSPGSCAAGGSFGYRTTGYTGPFSSTHYMEFTLTPAANSAVNLNTLTVYCRGNGTRPTSWEVRTSEDNYASVVSSDVNISGSACTNLSMDVFVQSTDAVTIRVYFYGAGNGTGNLDLMNITGDGFGNLLPVKLLSFDAVKTGATNRLVWKVAGETNFNHYLVERSTDGKTYKPLAKVNGTGSQEYSYTDSRPAARNFYRLSLVDRNGASIRGKVVTMVNASNQVAAQLLPNLVSTNTTLALSMNEPGEVKIAVIDQGGRSVMHTKARTSSASQNIPLNFSSLSRGTYQLVVETSGGERQTLRFVKQ